MFSKFILTQVTFMVLLLFHSISCEDVAQPKHDIYFDRMSVETGREVLVVDLKVDKFGDLEFKVNGHIEHLQEFNTDWSMYIKVFKSDTADGAYSMIVKLPAARTDICAILKKEYKNYFYEVLKDYSNAPHYDTCPLPAAKYDIKDYPFNASAFDKFISKGYYRISAFFSHKEEMDIIQYDIYFHVKDI